MTYSVIDALIVGMDLAAQKAGTRTVKKTIFLFTNGGCGVNEDDLQVIVDELKKQAFRLNVVCALRARNRSKVIW